MSSSRTSTRAITSGDPYTTTSISTLTGTFSTLPNIPTTVPGGPSAPITQFPSTNPGCAMVETYRSLSYMASCCLSAPIVAYNPYNQGPFVYCNAQGQTLNTLTDCLVGARNLTIDGQVLCDNGTTSSVTPSTNPTSSSSAMPTTTSSAASSGCRGLGDGDRRATTLATWGTIMVLISGGLLGTLL